MVTLEDKNKKTIRNSAIIIVLLLALAAVISIPFWSRGGVKTSEAAQDIQNMDPDDTIIDSRTGQVVPVPQSDPEMQAQSQNQQDTIYNSRTGEEAPVPTSDPGN